MRAYVKERNYWTSKAISHVMLKNSIKRATTYRPLSFATTWSICTHVWNMRTDVGRPPKMHNNLMIKNMLTDLQIMIQVNSDSHHDFRNWIMQAFIYCWESVRMFQTPPHLCCLATKALLISPPTSQPKPDQNTATLALQVCLQWHFTPTHTHTLITTTVSD